MWVCMCVSGYDSAFQFLGTYSLSFLPVHFLLYTSFFFSFLLSSSLPPIPPTLCELAAAATTAVAVAKIEAFVVRGPSDKRTSHLDFWNRIEFHTSLVTSDAKGDASISQWIAGDTYGWGIFWDSNGLRTTFLLANHTKTTTNASQRGDRRPLHWSPTTSRDLKPVGTGKWSVSLMS